MMMRSGRTQHWWCLVFICALLAACGGGGGGGTSTPPTPTPQSQTITFANAGPVSGSVGTTVTNAASGGGGTGAITYTSSNTAAGTVNSATGVVTLVAVGTTTITATKAADSTYGTATSTYTINVTPGAQSLVFLQAGPLNVPLGSTNANGATGGAGTGAISYASSNTNAVTVDATGTATAVGVGTATITATKAADTNYAQAQATYTINSQMADKIGAFIGPSGTDVSLPRSANGKQFGRARVSDCSLTDTVATCALAELNPVSGGPITDGRATLTTPAYYAIVNGSTVGTPIDVRANRFGNRVGHAAVWFKNRYWVISGAEPVWPAPDIYNYSYTAKADVWSSADGKSWKLETAEGGFGARWFHQAVVFNNRIWILSGGPIAVPSPSTSWYTDVWSSADGVTWRQETADSQLPWWSASLYVVVFNNQLLAVSGGQTYTSTTGVFTQLSTTGALTGSTTTGRRNATLTAYNNQLWFIGGQVAYPITVPNTGDAMNDVWKSSDGIAWTQVTAHAAFSPRFQHSAYVANGKLWVLGGRAVTTGVLGPYSGDAWSTTDGANWTKENTNALATGFLMPGVQETGKFTIFGGVQAAFQNNVWQTTDGANWSELTTYAPFSPRQTMGTEFNGQMWIIGGQANSVTAGKNVNNEIWRSSDGLNWTRVTPAGALFSPRNRHAVVAFNNKLWVIGGWDELPDLGGTGTRFNDVWSSPDGVNWTQQTPAGGTIFSPRLGHATLVYGGKLWVIGGDIAGASATMVNDVWSTTDGTTWVQATANAAFSTREGHGAVVLNNAMWVTGGDAGSATFADTWKSTDGVTWSPQQPVGTSFSARTHHGAAVLNGRMYVIGGAAGPYFGAEAYNDVWSSADGTNWRRDTPAAGFAARSIFATFVHNNELWLAGGLGSGPFNDVWRSSDGVNWKVGFTHDIVAP